MSQVSDVEVIVGPAASLPGPEVAAWFEAARPHPFADDEVLAALDELAKALRAPSVTRVYPELAPLSFFLRRRGLARLLEGVTVPADCVRVPRGRVLHIPPANVDTIFLYTLAISLIAGNANLVRLSPRTGGAAAAVIEALAAVADAHPEVFANQLVVRFDRDEQLLQRASAAADLRMLWGGDDSVNRLRQHPLPVHGRELTFPDRFSSLAISLEGWERLSEPERAEGVRGIVNDIAWFDQVACASPRLLYWVGPESLRGPVRAQVLDALAAALRRDAPELEAAMAVERRVRSYGAVIAGELDRIELIDDELLMGHAAGDVMKEWYGPMTFAEKTVGSLSDLATDVDRRDQTLTHLGFGHGELLSFVSELNGRGYDRVVPAGQALSFGPVWDGESLIDASTRLVEVRAAQ